MRKVVFIAVFFGLLACQYHDSSTWSSPRIDFSAAKGNVITTGVPSFQVVIVSVYDSRCPSDVVCIWGGTASVTFRVGSNEFSLFIGQSKIFAVDQKNYELTLTDVTPYPNTKVAAQEKKAVFTLKPL